MAMVEMAGTEMKARRDRRNEKDEGKDRRRKGVRNDIINVA